MNKVVEDLKQEIRNAERINKAIKEEEENEIQRKSV